MSTSLVGMRSSRSFPTRSLPDGLACRGVHLPWLMIPLAPTPPPMGRKEKPSHFPSNRLSEHLSRWMGVMESCSSSLARVRSMRAWGSSWCAIPCLKGA